VKRVGGYTASTTTLTVTRAYTAQVATAVTITLHRYDPRTKDQAINQAVRHLFPLLHKPLVDESIVVDDRLSNSDFETFASSAFTGWSTSGTPTLTAETSIVKHGTNSAKVVAGGTQALLYQAPAIPVSAVIGKTARFDAWAYTATAAAVRPTLVFGGADADTDGDAHAGDST